ncbi:MAG: hypothetical protein KAY37_16655 [Phycisphaerae bacterium]|nr:hypothetical protein [Phycisphaerae bacterium]
MVKLLKKVENVLNAKLSEFRNGLEEETSGRILGFIVSSAFTGRTHEERQARLAKILKKELNSADLAKIGPIVTMTPEEADYKDVLETDG